MRLTPQQPLPPPNKVVDTFTKVAAYWKAKNAPDAVTFAESARDAAKAIADGQGDKAANLMKLQQQCGGCHMAHRGGGRGNFIRLNRAPKKNLSNDANGGQGQSPGGPADMCFPNARARVSFLEDDVLQQPAMRVIDSYYVGPAQCRMFMPFRAGPCGGAFAKSPTVVTWERCYCGIASVEQHQA